MDKAIEDKSKDVMEHKLYLWENLSELDRAEKSAVRQIVTQQVAASESLAEKKKRYRKMMAIPYFGRIDFQEKGQPEVLPLYIGIHSFSILPPMKIWYTTGVPPSPACSMIMN